VTWRRAWATYVTAHVGKSLLWSGSDLLTLYLLVSVYGLAPMTAGMLFLIGLAANALADFAVGNHLARRPRHAGPIAAAALVLSGISFPATVLLAPYGAPALLAATLLFRIAYSGVDVPHNALLTRLGDTPARAVSLSRGRTVGTALASLVVAGVASGGKGIGTAALLWAIASGGVIIGATMVPLLIAVPPRSSTIEAERSVPRALPLPFVVASVIGIVALGALAKAVLHLLDAWHRGGDGRSILTLLILGRTASALLPIRLANARHGLRLLAVSYVAAAFVAIGFAWNAGSALLALLGLALGTTNLIGWAILPVLRAGPRGYGLYTMASKLALGTAGLALAGGLGRVPTFTAGSYVAFVLMVAAGCIVTALLLLLPGLTRSPARGLPAA
jgi:hypothetical protein